MKHIYKTIILTSCFIFLAGCRNNSTSSSSSVISSNTSISSSTSSTSTTSSTSHEKPKEGEISNKYENLGQYSQYKTVQKGGSYSGYFTEVSCGRFLAVNTSYEFYFTSAYSVDPTYVVESLFESHATVRYDDNNKNKFYLDTHTAGDTVLIIRNAINEICYTQVIRIRPAYTDVTVLDIMYQADYYRTIKAYEGYTGKWIYSLLEDNQEHNSVVSGSDDYDSATCKFGLRYDSYSPYTDLYYFVATNLNSTSPYTTVSTVAVSRCGDTMYIYTLSGEDEHLLTILYNIDVQYVYDQI